MPYVVLVVTNICKLGLNQVTSKLDSCGMASGSWLLYGTLLYIRLSAENPTQMANETGKWASQFPLSTAECCDGLTTGYGTGAVI